MSYSLLILIVSYLIRTVRNLCYHLFWWERKEYRFDRMSIHLKETYQGRKWLFGSLTLLKWIVLFLSFFTINLGYVIYGLFIFEAVKNIIELKIGWKLPQLRGRVVVIFFLTFSILSFSFWSLLKRNFDLPLALLFSDKLLGPVIALLIFISNRIFAVYKNLKIELAKLKISKAQHLKIIGVTGSYGKTTTKELIAQILGTKYKILKTSGSQNTDIGIAEKILSSNLSLYDYFVCEMAAYKKGEIEKICQMLKDRIIIGVITGINEQHQSLFKTIENTKKAKFELIEAVNKNGIAVFNARCKNITDLILWAKQKKLKVIAVKNLVRKLPLQIHGSHFRENLSLAIKVAEIIGMSKSEIRKAVDILRLPQKTMNLIKRGELFLIDNTFNSNPDGVYAALNYLKEYERPRILVLQPLIELGKYSEKVHRKIGKLSSRICDRIVLTNRNFYRFFIEGVEKNTGKVFIGDFPKITKGCILFQGKEAEKYLKEYD